MILTRFSYCLLLILCCLGGSVFSPVMAVNYWWHQPPGLLVQLQLEQETVVVSQPVQQIERRAEIAVRNRDQSCWLTDSFQGQLLKHTTGQQSTAVSGLAAPVSVVYDEQTDTFWVADAALNLVTQISTDGRMLQQITVQSPKELIMAPDSNCWVLTWRGLHPIAEGQPQPLVAAKPKLFSGSRKAVWWTDQLGRIFAYNQGETHRLPFALPDCRSILVTPDGGCWLLRREMAIRLDGRRRLLGEVLGLDKARQLVYQPTDQSCWAMDAGGDRAVLLPGLDQMSANQLPALVGWKQVKNSQAIQYQMVSGLRWQAFADREPSPPPQDTQPVEVVETKPQAKKVEPVSQPEPVAPASPVSEEPAEPESVPASPLPIVQPEGEPVANDPEPIETAPEPELVAPASPVPEEPARPEVVQSPPSPATEPEEKPLTERMKVVRIPLDQTFDQTPKFADGGVLSVGLAPQLSQKRILNTNQMLGRRFIWNFGDQSYTLLLGLSVEAYNLYSNLDRTYTPWKQMVVEGTSLGTKIGQPMAEIANRNNWDRQKLANFVLSMVQSLPYTSDDVATGYDEFKMYPFETLVAGGGDCEDTVMLAASILAALDYDLLLLNPEGHLALGVAGDFKGAYYTHDNQRYFYSETTGQGWRIGQLPDQFKSVPVVLHEVPQLNQ